MWLFKWLLSVLYIITAVTVFCLNVFKTCFHCSDVIVLDKIIFGCLYIILCDRHNVCSADFVRFFDDMTLKWIGILLHQYIIDHTHRSGRRLCDKCDKWRSCNIPYSIKIIHLCLIWCRIVRFRNVHPCYMVPYCLIPRCPPLPYGAALSSLAMSALTISMVSRCPVPRFQSPHIGDLFHKGW